MHAYCSLFSNTSHLGELFCYTTIINAYCLALSYDHMNTIIVQLGVDIQMRSNVGNVGTMGTK